MPRMNQDMALLCLLIPLLPLLGFLMNGLGNRKISKGLIGFIGCSTVLVSFLISIYLFLDFKANGSQPYTVDYYN